MTAADNALDALAAIDQNKLRAEITNLRAIRDWALQSLHLNYQPGDRVVITSPKPSQVGGGWHHYREALAPGQTGIAGEITFNRHSQRWQCMVGMDRTWSISERPLWPNGTEVTRYWHGPVDETPDGYKPPSSGDQRVHHFAMDVRWLAKAPTDTKTDTPECGWRLGLCTGCPNCQTEPSFGVAGCTCRSWTRQTDPPRYLDQPGDTVDMISGWEIGDCPHHKRRTAPAIGEQPHA